MGFWFERYIWMPPKEEEVHLKRPIVPGAICPACGSDDVRRYPIANHYGPRIVTKCQACLEVIKLERPKEEDMWPPFRALTYDWEASPAERASRELSLRPGAGKD